MSAEDRTGKGVATAPRGAAIYGQEPVWRDPTIDASNHRCKLQPRSLATASSGEFQRHENVSTAVIEKDPIGGRSG